MHTNIGTNLGHGTVLSQPFYSSNQLLYRLFCFDATLSWCPSVCHSLSAFFATQNPCEDALEKILAQIQSFQRQQMRSETTRIKWGCWGTMQILFCCEATKKLWYSVFSPKWWFMMVNNYGWWLVTGCQCWLTIVMLTTPMVHDACCMSHCPWAIQWDVFAGRPRMV